MQSHDLLYLDTDELLARILEDGPEFPRLIAALRAYDPWEPELDVRLYDLYRTLLVTLIGRRPAVSEIEQFGAHLGTASGVLSRKKGSSLAPKLTILADLLRDFAYQIEQLAPETALQRAHIKPLLRFLNVEGGRVSRVDVRDTLGLADANLSRVLNLAESSQLITRQRIGNDVFVELTSKGAELCERFMPEEHAVAHAAPEAVLVKTGLDTVVVVLGKTLPAEKRHGAAAPKQGAKRKRRRKTPLERASRTSDIVRYFQHAETGKQLGVSLHPITAPKSTRSEEEGARI